MERSGYKIDKRKDSIENDSTNCIDHCNDGHKYFKLVGHHKIIFVFIVAVTIIIIRTFILDQVTVNGVSMYNTFSDGDVLLVQKVNIDPLKRFDIVIIQNNYFTIIKRVIGLPGETISINESVYIDGILLENDYGETIKDGGIANEKIVLEEDEYFVLGDNRNNSIDSRTLGTINIEKIKGKVIFQIFHFEKTGKISSR